MGMQDRDYYREWWAKKQGYVEKSKFRVSAGAVDDDGGAYLKFQKMPPISKKPSQWHPALIVIFTISLCFAVFVLLRIVSKLFSTL